MKNNIKKGCLNDPFYNFRKYLLRKKEILMVITTNTNNQTKFNKLKQYQKEILTLLRDSETDVLSVYLDNINPLEIFDSYKPSFIEEMKPVLQEDLIKQRNVITKLKSGSNYINPLIATFEDLYNQINKPILEEGQDLDSVIEENLIYTQFNDALFNRGDAANGSLKEILNSIYDVFRGYVFYNTITKKIEVIPASSEVEFEFSDIFDKKRTLIFLGGLSFNLKDVIFGKDEIAKNIILLLSGVDLNRDGFNNLIKDYFLDELEKRFVDDALNIFTKTENAYNLLTRVVKYSYDCFDQECVDELAQSIFDGVQEFGLNSTSTNQVLVTSILNSEILTKSLVRTTLTEPDFVISHNNLIEELHNTIMTCGGKLHFFDDSTDDKVLFAKSLLLQSETKSPLEFLRDKRISISRILKYYPELYKEKDVESAFVNLIYNSYKNLLSGNLFDFSSKKFCGVYLENINIFGENRTIRLEEDDTRFNDYYDIPENILEKVRERLHRDFSGKRFSLLINPLDSLEGIVWTYLDPCNQTLENIFRTGSDKIISFDTLDSLRKLGVELKNVYILVGGDEGFAASFDNAKCILPNAKQSFKILSSRFDCDVKFAIPKDSVFSISEISEEWLKSSTELVKDFDISVTAKEDDGTPIINRCLPAKSNKKMKLLSGPLFEL